MRKHLILSFIVSGIIFGSVGYVTAYIRGLQYANDMVVRTHCDILLLQSVSFLNSSDVASLIDKVEENCNCSASLIAANKPLSPEETKKNISEALEKWEEAKRKFGEYKSSYKEQKD
ncbi:MAG: hypothetical protein ACYSU3_22220 [Planctomycetota bacterium]